MNLLFVEGGGGGNGRVYVRAVAGRNKKPLSNFAAKATQSKGAVLTGIVVESPRLSSAIEIDERNL